VSRLGSEVRFFGWARTGTLKSLGASRAHGQNIDVYFPGVTQGMILRVRRWIACPDIGTQKKMYADRNNYRMFVSTPMQ
jgi:hypothetical protein